MGKITETIQELKVEYEGSDSVWFFVDIRYRILAYNKKASQNSVTFHNKEIAAGQSILDYARDTKNQIDSLFIECFGKAASGQKVELEQPISYNSSTINSKSNYTPVFHNKELIGISIVVDYTPPKDEKS
jgi:hypothetical protein